MSEGDDDKHLLLLLPIMICATASIGGSFAINLQLNDLNSQKTTEVDLNNKNALIIQDIQIKDFRSGALERMADNLYKSEKNDIDFGFDFGDNDKETVKSNIRHDVVSASSSIKWNLEGTKTVYLTSDRIIDIETDRKFLERIKFNLEKSGINVIIDSRASYPNQVPRAIENAPKNSAVIIVNYNCAGTIKDLCEGISGPQTNGKTNEGYLYEHAKDLNGVIYVNVSPETILKNSSYLPRAHDDGFSSESFEGLINPAKYLLDNGIALIDSFKASKPIMGNEKADAVTNQIIVLIKQ